MTDQQLKHILQSAPAHTDEQFVQKVMNQIPQTTINYRPIWVIRIASILVAVIALMLLNTESVSDFFYHLIAMLHEQPSYGMTLLGGIMVACGTLWICRTKEVI